MTRPRLFPAALSAIVTVLTSAAIGQGALPTPALPDPMPPPPMVVLLPEDAARIDSAVASLDGLGETMLERAGIPGLAIGVVHRGETVFARGFGTANVDTGAPVDAETVFLLASLSKAVGASVVAHEVGQGTVTWETPVRDYLPAFDLGDPWVSAHVTIGDLYAHRSGLPDHAGDDLEDLGYGRDAVLERLRLLPMGPFRASYAYTNFGLTAAAEATAVAAGTDWASLSETAVYGPLGMTATSSRHADYMDRDNRASSHTPERGEYRVNDSRQPDAQSPAGGVSSTVTDMARWMAMILADGGDLIPREALRPAISGQMISGAPMATAARGGAYGFGFNVGVRPSGRVELSHSGAFALGASTAFSMLPGLDLGIVVLTNAQPTGVAEAITATFMDRAELGLDSRDWFAAYAPLMAPLIAPVGALVGVEAPENPTPPQALDTYVGQYENAYFGPARIAAGAEGLVLELGPDDDHALALTHWDGDSFVAYPVTENQPAGTVSQVLFTREGDRITSVTVEHLDGEGLGRFTR